MMETHVSFGSCVSESGAHAQSEGRRCVGGYRGSECLAKRDGRSPVSVSAAVLRRHKVTLCFPRQISSAGEQSGIQHFNWLMLIKTFFVG